MKVLSLHPLRSWSRAGLLALIGATAPLGCTQQYLPNTDVVETDFNREVIEFCEKYRHAVESKNVPQLLEMADSSYYEDGGTVDTSDDIDLAGLKEYLETKFKKTSGIRYEIRYRAVSEGRKDVIFVDYTYSASYKIPTTDTCAAPPCPDGDVWRRRVADNRLELLHTNGTFKVLSGM